ncbi:hypothetical protein FGO68_gene14102 [Halteria grandinella]|uniref:Uncharacterized protein n=1 Tax=Halteria grandinella TaxID=5974 RepID=A0A8J8T9X4_HALGN|nr:hypothetical protein FGO68_gene14102 [Halteria grandinella]
MINTAINEQWEEPIPNDLNERLLSIEIPPNKNPQNIAPPVTDLQNRLANIIKDIKSELCFKNEQNIKKSAADFYQDLICAVPLSNLYEIVETCFYSLSMPYCPILVKCNYEDAIMPYQLQVWSKHGEMVYSKDLKYPLIAWCITFQELVFLPHKEDQKPGELCYYVVYFDEKNKTHKEYRVSVKNNDELKRDSKPVIGFFDKKLYIARKDSEGQGKPLKTVITTLDLNEIADEETFIDLELLQRDLSTCTFGEIKIHAFTNTRQQQKDDNGKKMKDRDGNPIYDHKFYYIYETDEGYIEFKSSSEIARNDKQLVNGKIKKLKIIYDNSQNKWQFALALRECGHVDFYWNYHYIHNEDDTEFDDIEADFENFYLKEKNSNRVYQIQLDSRGKMGLHKQ